MFAPWPAGREVEGSLSCGAGDPAGEVGVVSAQGVGGDDRLLESDPAGPAGEVVGDDVQSESGCVGAEPS